MSDQKNFEKDPDAILDFSIDWTDWLAGDTISTGTWIVQSGLTKVKSFYTTSKDTVFVSSGVAGQTYSLTNRITTANGRVNDETIYILVKEQ